MPLGTQKAHRPAAGDRASLQARTMRILIIAQVLSGAGLAAGITVGALLAEQMLGSTSVAGLPAALFTAGSAAAALLVGRISQRSGRRVGLSAGYAAGALGAAGVVLAAVLDSVPLLVVSLVIYGAGFATSLQARYAGADLAEPSHRGRAVSFILVATTLGAVAGPNLVDVTGNLAEAIGIPRLAGPFGLAALAYGLAALVLSALLRPDPLISARAFAVELDAAPTTSAPAGAAASPGSGRPAGPPRRPVSSVSSDVEGDSLAARGRSLRLAASAMIVTQVVMTAVMTMTPIHMRDHGHGLGATGLVIAIHIGCMYLPSPLTGVLADRLGRRPVIAAGALVLLAAGIISALAPAGSVALLALSLGLLGLGWNFGLIGGTALVTDAAPLETRAKTQGTVDLGVALAGAAGGLSSGVIVASTSFTVLSLAGGALALAIIPIMLRTGGSHPDRGSQAEASEAEPARRDERAKVP